MGAWFHYISHQIHPFKSLFALALWVQRERLVREHQHLAQSLAIFSLQADKLSFHLLPASAALGDYASKRWVTNEAWTVQFLHLQVQSHGEFDKVEPKVAGPGRIYFTEKLFVFHLGAFRTDL